ncbi:hypothetical protein GGR77_001467 [Xanthomonas translucens]
MFIKAVALRQAAKHEGSADTIPTSGSDRRLLADLIARRDTYWTLIEFKDSASGVDAEREKTVVPSVCSWLQRHSDSAKSHDRCHYYAEDRSSDIGFWGYRKVVCSRQPLPESPAFWSGEFISRLFDTPPGIGLGSEEFLSYTQALLACTTGGSDGVEDVKLVVALNGESCHYFEVSLEQLISDFSPSAGHGMKM